MVPDDEERASLGQAVEASHLGAEVGGEALEYGSYCTEEGHVPRRADRVICTVEVLGHPPTMHPGRRGVVGDEAMAGSLSVMAPGG